ncbi:hypothetical protein IWQ61_010710 [Dispira simplex]|nr:hypothetical protein IWQ61_010710 [Dispira simplex]
MSKYGYPQEPASSSHPNEDLTTSPALDAGENGLTLTPSAPSSCCSLTTTSTGTSKSCSARKSSSSAKVSQKRSTKCACQGNTCQCSKDCRCGHSSPIVGDNPVIGGVTLPIELPAPPGGETSDTLPRPTDKDTAPSVCNIYIDPYGAPSCACGCDKPSQECSDCMKDLCEEFLLRPPDL